MQTIEEPDQGIIIPCALVLGIGIVAPIAIRSLAQSMGSIKLFFAVMAVSVIAYLVRGHRKPHPDQSERRRVIECTPVLSSQGPSLIYEEYAVVHRHDLRQGESRERRAGISQR